MTKTNPPKTKPLNLDQRLVNRLGRLPASIIIGLCAGAIVDIIVFVTPYFYEYDNLLDQLDNISRFAKPLFPSIALSGAIAGMALAITISLLTNRIHKALTRILIGIPTGLVIKAIVELVIRLVEEKQLDYVLRYLSLFGTHIILGGIIAGVVVALLPLPSKTENCSPIPLQSMQE
jgi:ABC-type Fe3+-siderophore transport system permease subunit